MSDDHSLDGLKNPFQFAVMATLGCFVGHIFMYPLGLFELSGQLGAGLSSLFNGVAGVSPFDPVPFTELGTSAVDVASTGVPLDAPLDTHFDGAVHDAAGAEYDPGPDGVFTKGEAGFEDCVTGGGATHFHGTEMVCHPPE